MGRYQINSIHARQILDSRGNPTIEVDIATGAVMGRASVPSGASTGEYEALELRDKGKEYGGKGVLTAVRNVDEIISKKLIGVNVQKQKLIDKTLIELDGTGTKSALGANALLGVSLAAARTAALAKKQLLYEYLQGLTKKQPSLPVPFSNVINGGKHAGGDLRFQEFMLAPVHAKTFSDATRMVAEIYQDLHKKLSSKYGPGAANVGDEGGFAPPLKSPAETLELLQKTIEGAGYGKEVKLAMDPASSEFFKDGAYEVEPGKRLSGGELVDYYGALLGTFPIVSLEDGFEQDDFPSWKEFTKKHGAALQIVGDDLLVTNVKRIQLAKKHEACNALLLKVNQIGTLSEAIAAANKAFSLDWNVMVSHRSGETDDAFISHLAVALDCGQIKLGAPCRGERTAKYNELLRIEEHLKTAGKPAHYKAWK